MMNSHTKLGRRAQRVSKGISIPLIILGAVAAIWVGIDEDGPLEWLIDVQVAITGDSYYPILNFFVAAIFCVGGAMGIIHIIASFLPESQAEKDWNNNGGTGQN